MVDRVVMEERAAPAAPGAEPLGQHLHDRGELGARQVAIGRGAADEREEFVLAPFLRRDFGDDLLRQHVERLLGDRKAVQFAARDAVEERRAFDQLVARLREEAALGGAVDGVARASDPLQEGGDRARRAELADQIDLPDVDAEFERSGRHQRLQRAALEALLGVQPALLGEAAVMRGDMFLAEPHRQLAGHALDHAAGVDENQGRAMRAGQRCEAVVNLLPDLARHHRFQRRRRQFEREVALSAVAGVDDRAIPVGRGADQEAGDRLDRPLRCRQADALQPPAAQRVEPLKGQRQMGAALVRRHRVDLVDNDCAGRGQHPAAGLGAEQDVK